MAKKNQEFLEAFTATLQERILLSGGKPALFGRSSIFDNLEYHVPYDCEAELAKARLIREMTDKIMAIIRDPHITVTTNEIVTRAELAGHLSHESFAQTMRDPQLWRDKEGEMAPESIHTVETVDTINIYENQFISMLLDVLEDEVELLLADIAPLVESLQEHFERTTKTFGRSSIFEDYSKRKGPYEPFMLSNGETHEELLMLCEKLNKRIKHLKCTEFYKVTSNKRFSRNVMPTNILMHDPLYNFCYKNYLTSFRKEKDPFAEDDLYYNYVTAVICHYFNAEQDWLVANQPKITFGSNRRLELQSLRIRRGNFSYYVRFDDENNGVEFKAAYLGGKREGVEKRNVRYYWLLSHVYSEKNAKVVEAKLEDLRKGYDDVILVTAKNAEKKFGNVANLSYYRENVGDIIRNLMTSMMMIFDVKPGLYDRQCPFCGSEEVVYSGSNFVCDHCSSQYSIYHQTSRDLVWLTKMGGNH